MDTCSTPATVALREPVIDESAGGGCCIVVALGCSDLPASVGCGRTEEVAEDLWHRRVLEIMKGMGVSFVISWKHTGKWNMEQHFLIINHSRTA